MHHLIVQGLFNISYLLAFISIAAKLWSNAKKTKSPISKCLSLSSFFVAIEYVCFSVATLLFAHNLLGIKIAGVLTDVFFFTALCCAVPVIAYAFPKFPPKPLVIIMALAGAIVAVIDSYRFNPDGINHLGLVDFTFPSLTVNVEEIAMLLVFGPISVAFMYVALRKKAYMTGASFSVGLLLTIVCFPLTYLAKTYETFVFFSLLVSLGLFIMVLGIVLYPALRTEQKHV